MMDLVRRLDASSVRLWRLPRLSHGREGSLWVVVMMLVLSIRVCNGRAIEYALDSVDMDMDRTDMDYLWIAKMNG